MGCPLPLNHEIACSYWFSQTVLTASLSCLTVVSKYRCPNSISLPDQLNHYSTKWISSPQVRLLRRRYFHITEFIVKNINQSERSVRLDTRIAEPREFVIVAQRTRFIAERRRRLVMTQSANIGEESPPAASAYWAAWCDTTQQWRSVSICRATWLRRWQNRNAFDERFDINRPEC